jgi:quinone-modifying oxidoreductase, subunit QmoB
MEDKIGVFICTGYGIGDALDVEALSTLATGEMKAKFCKTVPSCEGSDLEAIKQDIASESLTKVVIAGISSRCFATGDFPDDVIVEMAALREMVVWCQPPGEEDTQMMAEDYLRMAIAKVGKMSPVDCYQPDEEIDKSIMILGGGTAGMTAALEAANTGYAVILVEREEKLGGWLAKQHMSIPSRAPFRDLEDTGIDALIGDIEKNSRIKVYTSATTGSVSGAPGMFEVVLNSTGNGKPEGEEVEKLRVGAIIQATGWKPKVPENMNHLGYGTIKNVVRNVELEEMVKNQGKITRPSDGKEVKSVAFIQCAGSKAKGGNSYCSSICCLTSLKQAKYLRQMDSDAKAYIFYEFIRTPGHYEDFYRSVQEDPGVFLTKGEVVSVTEDGDGQLTLTAENTMLGKNIQTKVDLVVLATGMVPNSADSEAIRLLVDAKHKVIHGDSDAQKESAAKTVEELKEHEGTAILNLDYRQGPDLPVLQYGFPDSHFICFPYETRRTGIYATGCVRQPMDGLASREDATGAALKAIQCLEMTSRGEAVHPRSGDKSYPEFFLQKCTQCKRCTEECPFGVLNEDEKGTPLLRATRCRRCGVCMGACPERIVSFKDYSVNIIGSMIKSVDIPDEFDEKPRILVLMCENDAIPALELAGQHRMQYSPFVRIIPLRCLGSVNIVWISEALSAGFDGIILFGCKFGDDYQCHFIRGSELAESRGENVKEKLTQMALENERVELHQLQISEYARIPEIINRFAEMIEEIGMNPFKGM